jgi:uncharacterized integral membrane protein
MSLQTNLAIPTIYQGQFGEYTIDKEDRLGVIIYRSGLAIAALTLAIASNIVISQNIDNNALQIVTVLFGIFSLALGISLFTIHIYLAVLHRFLQALWAIGTLSAIALQFQTSEPLALYVYNHPLTLFGIGCTFAALTGIYFKEAFCFNRLETKFLTPLVPFLLLGHMGGFLSSSVEQVLLAIWTILFIIFAVRKVLQNLDPDIGDKSVFHYLKQQKAQ